MSPPVENLATLEGNLSGPTIVRMSFSPDGERLAVSNMDGVPKVWDLPTQEVVFPLMGHKAMSGGIAYNPDGRRLATGDESG